MHELHDLRLVSDLAIGEDNNNGHSACVIFAILKRGECLVQSHIHFSTATRVYAAQKLFAALHAGFHGLDAASRARLLPLGLHPHLAPGRKAMTRALTSTAVKNARRKAPEVVSAAVADTYARALERWDALLRYWYAEPLTLVHGDSHLANCFEYLGPSGPAVGLLDFQGVHWSKGIRDVAYFLIHSLDADLLAEHEDALIDHYLQELSRRGVEVDPARTREEYRAFSLQALTVGIVAVGLGGFTERETTTATVLRREVAAIERLDFAGWLDRL